MSRARRLPKRRARRSRAVCVAASALGAALVFVVSLTTTVGPAMAATLQQPQQLQAPLVPAQARRAISRHAMAQAGAAAGEVDVAFDATAHTQHVGQQAHLLRTTKTLPQGRPPPPPPPVTGERINVFILPHSHDDAGWVQTVDEYYEHFVRDIYTSAVEALINDPFRQRTFQSVEQVFFSRWWDEATAEQRANVHLLIEERRWEFAVGGWVMPDEAVTDYASLIETMTLGHEFINSTFGVDSVPRFGFQVDPFGASSVFAWQSAAMGFDGHVISRINTWEKSARQRTQDMEFVWRPSDSWGPSGDIFTHVMDQYSYCVPFIPLRDQLDYLCALSNQTDCPGGNFEWDGDDGRPAEFWWHHPPYPGVNSSSVQFYADFMVNNTLERAAWFQTTNLLWPFGCDFQHFNATRMFESMDQIINEVNRHSGPGQRYEGIHLRYGRLSDYFSSLHELNLTWPVRDAQDFLPYSTQTSGGSKPWTGFYASHAQLKGWAREHAARLRAVEQVMAHAVINGLRVSAQDAADYDVLRRAVAVLQHHDAVTGTEGRGIGQHEGVFEGQVGGIVADYMIQLNNGTSAASDALLGLMNRLVEHVGASATGGGDGDGDGSGGGTSSGNGSGSGNGGDSGSGGGFAADDDAAMPAQTSVVVDGESGGADTGDDDGRGTVKVLTPALSLSSHVMVKLLEAGAASPVTIYNPLAWPLRKWVRLSVPRSDLAVVDNSGDDTLSQVNAAPAGSGSLPFDLYFFVEVPALGYRSYVVEVAAPIAGDDSDGGFGTRAAAEVGQVGERRRAGAAVNISNDFYSLSFNGETGLLDWVTLFTASSTPIDVRVNTDLLQYHSAWNATAGAVSGSYVFRPLGEAVPVRPDRGVVRVVPVVGSHVQEVQQHFTNDFVVTYRLYGSGSSAEPDATVGGFIDVTTSIGPLEGNREAIMRFSTSLDTSPQPPLPGITSQFFSDNNGVQVQRRLYNATPTEYAPDTGTIIAGNYCPMVRTAFLRDTRSPSGMAFAAVSSQSHGCTSMRSGELEVMLHRRALQDDGLGACYNPHGEHHINTTRADHCPPEYVPLNVTTRVEPSLALILDMAAPASKLRHLVSQMVNNPPVVMFAQLSENGDARGMPPNPAGEAVAAVANPGAQPADAATSWMAAFGAQFSPLSYTAFPLNAHLLTLRAYRPNVTDEVVLRVQHLYEVDDDDPNLAQPVKVKIGSMFFGKHATSHDERSLTVVRPATKGVVDRWKWKAAFADGDDDDADARRHDAHDHATLAVAVGSFESYDITIAPQSVRTFLLTFDANVGPPPPGGLPKGVIGAIVSVGVVVAVVGVGLAWKWWDKRRFHREMRRAMRADGSLLARRDGRSEEAALRGDYGGDYAGQGGGSGGAAGGTLYGTASSNRSSMSSDLDYDSSH